MTLTKVSPVKVKQALKKALGLLRGGSAWVRTSSQETISGVSCYCATGALRKACGVDPGGAEDFSTSPRSTFYAACLLRLARASGSIADYSLPKGAGPNEVKDYLRGLEDVESNVQGWNDDVDSPRRVVSAFNKAIK